MRSLLVFVVLGAGLGCQTQFVGDAHIDPAACQAKCTEAGLAMAGMVYMGQYSSACVCEVPKPAAPLAPPPPPPGGPPGAPPGPGGSTGALALASAALGAGVGVIMQTRTAAQRNMYMPSTPPNIRPMGPNM